MTEQIHSTDIDLSHYTASQFRRPQDEKVIMPFRYHYIPTDILHCTELCTYIVYLINTHELLSQYTNVGVVQSSF